MPDIDRIDAIGPTDLLPSPLPDLALSRAGHDRVAELRTSPAAVAALVAEPGTLVLLVRDGSVPVTDGPDGVGLALLPVADVQTTAEWRAAVAGADRTAVLGESTPEPTLVLLGRVEGRGVVALLLPRGPSGQDGQNGREPGPAAADPGQPAGRLPGDARWAGLRAVGASLSATDVGLAVEAVALEAWHATHPRCPRCGGPTAAAAAGHERRCARDGSSHHPRSDPAVIMLVVDADDRVLLARQSTWPPRRMSLVAGFVEPGESLESAVRRETAEEVGVAVGDVRYLGSQPWPFPASLMLGFWAQAVSTDIRVDGVEVSEARWASRTDLVGLVDAGTVVLPPWLSIARRMIEWWLGREVDVSGAWR